MNGNLKLLKERKLGYAVLLSFTLILQLSTDTVAQVDTDGDGVADGVDNCLLIPNPMQEDNDLNGIGNACCCVPPSGDANLDGVNGNILDLSRMVDRLFRPPFPPYPCPDEANVNGTGGDGDIVDLNYMVNRVFRGGPPPVPVCI